MQSEAIRLSDQPLRTAIVGLQHNHINSVIRYAKKTGQMKILAVVEPEAGIRERYVTDLRAGGLHVAAYSTLEELLDRHTLDAAALAPVNSEKTPLAVACMEAGLHVLIDKPMAVSWEQLSALQNAHQRTGRIVSLMLTLRFDPCYVTARRVIQEGAIGRVVQAWLTRPHKLKRPNRPDWMFRRETYGGIIPDLCVHDIDVFRWVTCSKQTDIAQLYAVHGRYGVAGQGELEEAGHVLLRLTDGTVGSFEANWLTPGAAPYHGDCRAIFTGTHGTVEIDTVRNRVVLTTDQAGPMEVPLDPPGSVEEDFVRGVRHGKDQMILPPEEAFESTAWTLLARDAADQAGSNFT